jgi:hypothetical protein
MADSTPHSELLRDTTQLPVLVNQPNGKWTITQKECIHGFAEEWNTEGVDHNAIVPKIVDALNVLEDCPSIELEALKQVLSVVRVNR